jgi:hypothetical protein
MRFTGGVGGEDVVDGVAAVAPDMKPRKGLRGLFAKS